MEHEMSPGPVVVFDTPGGTIVDLDKTRMLRQIVAVLVETSEGAWSFEKMVECDRQQFCNHADEGNAEI